MDQNNRTRRGDLDIDSFRSDEPNFDRTRMRRQSGGFVDLGNESQYGTGGHQASGANEIFADIQVCKFTKLFFLIAIPFVYVFCFIEPSTAYETCFKIT